MLPGKISSHVVNDRLSWINRMLAEIRSLPLASQDEFLLDSRNIWSAKSCLRRALEALFDLGRHILAKGFGNPVSEFREIARGLNRYQVISPANLEIMEKLAGYRNRLVHFYQEVSAEELYEISTSQLGDVEQLIKDIKTWFIQHPDALDET